MNKETIHIAICFDDKFFRYGITLIESIILNNKKNKIHFHFILENLSNDQLIILNDLIQNSNNYYKIYKVPVELINLYKKETLQKFSINYFGRFLILPLLDESIDKILYLDADILVNDDLMQLWNTNLGDYLMAGVLDAFYIKYELSKIELFFDGTLDRYFNSGVLLIKTEYWRNIDNLKRYVNIVNEIADKTTLIDQDALNILLNDKIMILPPKYNFFNGFGDYPKGYYSDFYNIELLKEAFYNPVIIHFSFKRPDQINCFHFGRKYFWKYIENSQFSDYFNPPSLSERLKISFFSFANPKERGWIMELNINIFQKFVKLFFLPLLNSKIVKVLVKIKSKLKEKKLIF